MSGHSKWATIKRAKGKTDAARANVFTKIGRELAVAVKAGGPDPNNNAKLRDVISKAKAANMPNDNITRSIKKASGELGSINYDAITYEGYGAGGVAVIVETLTYNKNRTAGDVRAIMSKHGGSLGMTGCVSYMFDNKGLIVVERTAALSEDEVTELAIEAGADDVVTEDDAFEIYTSVSAFSEARKFLEEKGLTFLQAELTMIPQSKITLAPDKLETFLKMLEKLEENDDVQNIYHNVELPEEEEED